MVRESRRQFHHLQELIVMLGLRGRRPKILLALAIMVGGAPATNLLAQESYLGTWKVTTAVVAPWADKGRKPDQKEMRFLVGKTVTMKVNEITGPPAFACKEPNYQLSNFTADMLFQGAFGEMHDNDKSVDPYQLAATVGFQGASWTVLVTGCENEIDWHFVDEKTLAVGLNDYVYILKR
jgi:hypothetical protein